MVKTREQLERDIKALEDAGLDASEEKAQLKQLVLAGVPARHRQRCLLRKSKDRHLQKSFLSP